MIRVTIELVSANSGKVSTLGTATITNDGTGSEENSNYDVVFSKFGGHGVWRSGRVEGFDRKHRGGFDLLYLAMRAVVGNRNP